MESKGNNKHAIYTINGVSVCGDSEREIHDFYATDPNAIDLLIRNVELSKYVWESACGQGHLSERLQSYGFNVKSTDLIDRGFGIGGIDFLSDEITYWHGDIVTNPPYKHAAAFVQKALSIIDDGRKVAMFLKLTFLEGINRKTMFLNHPPHTVYVSSSRIMCAKNGDFESLKNSGGSAVATAWYVWVKGYQGNTIIKWIN